MNCGCAAQSLDSFEFQLIQSETSSEVQSLSGSDSGDSQSSASTGLSNKESEIRFYNEDDSFQTVVVEENLRAGDLCQILAMKNYVARDVNWAILERIPQLGLERNLEDHEDVLGVYQSWHKSNRDHENRFVFTKDFRKYEFFRNPQQFFPAELLDLEEYSADKSLNDSIELSRAVVLQNLIHEADSFPDVSGPMWIRDSCKQVWKKALFVLRGKVLYYTFKHKEKTRDVQFHELKQLRVCGHLDDYDIYTVQDNRKCFKAPSEFGLYLKPKTPSQSSPSPVSGNLENREFQCLSCDSERTRLCWLTAMRIAKYGRQIRENYKSLKSRQLPSLDGLSSSPKEYASEQFPVPSKSVRSRVAMDFTGNYGKVVEDPKEVEAIAAAEARHWNKKRRSHCRKIGGGILRGLEAGIHITQPWFHSGLSREEATALLSGSGTVDGVFLVRESRSLPGTYVLSVVHSGKISHVTISLGEDKGQIYYTLDKGITKFYDLLQMVEFYQLNIGSLPTMLTHYIVQPRAMLVSPSPVVAVSHITSEKQNQPTTSGKSPRTSPSP